MESFKNKFIEEAFEYLDQLEEVLLKLESTPEDLELIEQIFRIMHTLKGNSAMFGFSQIDQFTHQLETIYDLIRSGSMKVTAEVFDLTLASVDHIGNLLDDENSSESDVESIHSALLERVNKIVESGGDNESEDFENLKVASSGGVPVAKSPTYYIYLQTDPDILSNGTNPLYLIDDFCELGDCMAFPRLSRLPDFKDLEPLKCYTNWELLLSTDKGLESIDEVLIFVEDNCKIEIQEISNINLLKNEEFISRTEQIRGSNQEIGLLKIKDIIKTLSTNERSDHILYGDPLKHNKNNSKNSISSIRVSSDKLDDLINLVSELVTNQASLNLLASESKLPEIISIAENMEKVTRQLRDNTFDICLIPVDTIMTRFQRLVRDLSSELDKEVDLVLEGTETELDKNIIESLADPIMHILRNCMDHGIESKEERIRLGKPRKGKIILKAFYSGMHVYIEIQDDGSGIDPEKIRQKAVSRGIVSADSVLEDREVMDLVFQPGFSTATKVTDVSGRGVGMDVVRRKISDIRGNVSIDSTVHHGTTISIKLPLTLSIIDGLLVEINDTSFVIQLPVVDKVYEIHTDSLFGKFNNQVQLDGELLPFLYLREEFSLCGNPPEVAKMIVVKFEEKRVGLVVDEIIGEYQAVLKPLGKLFSRQELVSGSAILGDGTVALVLDTNKIIEDYSRIVEEMTVSETCVN